MTKSNWLVFFAGFGVMQIGGAINSPSLWRVVLVAALGLLYLGAGTQVLRDARRARSFLTAHPEHT